MNSYLTYLSGILFTAKSRKGSRGVPQSFFLRATLRLYHIDWERGYEFLDKEFQQITKDAEIGRKYVDKLAKVWLNNGHDAWAMIHADIQTQAEAAYPAIPPLRKAIKNFQKKSEYREKCFSVLMVKNKSAVLEGIELLASDFGMNDDDE